MLIYNGMNTLNQLIGGGLDGAGLTEILTEPSSNGSFRQVMAIPAQQTLLTESPTAMKAMSESILGMRVLVESVSAMNAAVGNETATSAVAASDVASYLVHDSYSTNDRMIGAKNSVGAYLNRMILVNHPPGTAGDLILAGQKTMHSVVWHINGLTHLSQSIEAMETVVTSPTAVLLISSSPVANNLAIASPYYVGYYLDHIRILDGNFISPALKVINLVEGDGIGSSADVIDLIGTSVNVNINISQVMESPEAVSAVLMCQKSAFAVASSQAGAAAVSVNADASQSFAENVYANSLVLASASVGAYLNKLLVASGGTSSTSLAAKTTLESIASDSTSMAAIIGSTAAMTALASSQAAMTTIFATNAAADSLLTSTPAKTIIYNSDAALSGLQANPDQIQRQITARGVSSGVAVSNYVWVAQGTKVILLRRWYVTGADFDAVTYGRDGTGVKMGSRSLNVNQVATGSVSGTYTSNGVPVSANDATGNFVAASSGLARDHWTVPGSTMNCNYLLV